MSLPRMLDDNFWGDDSSFIEKSLAIAYEQQSTSTGVNPTTDGRIQQCPLQEPDQQLCVEHKMGFSHPTAPPSPNIPSSHLSNSPGYSADEGRDFGHGSIERFSAAPEDGSLVSEPCSSTQKWDEMHAENTQERKPSNESLGTHSVRPMIYDDNDNIANLKGKKSTHMRLNIPENDSMMRSYTFGMGFNDPLSTATAKYQTQVPIGHGANTSSGFGANLQPVEPSAHVKGIEKASASGEDEQLKAMDAANSNVDHANTRTRRARVRSTTRTGVPRWTTHDLHIAQEMRRQGRTMARIAAALNRSENSVTGKLWRARGNDAHRSDKQHRNGESS